MKICLYKGYSTIIDKLFLQFFWVNKFIKVFSMMDVINVDTK